MITLLQRFTIDILPSPSSPLIVISPVKRYGSHVPYGPPVTLLADVDNCVLTP